MLTKDNFTEEHIRNLQSESRRDPLLQDILFEEPGYAQIIEKPIKSDLIKVEDPQLQVLVPSIECILGDKLIAFAPHTIGVPLHADKDMEIIKQFYDAIFNSGADTEEFFYRLRLKDGMKLRKITKSILKSLS